MNKWSVAATVVAAVLLGLWLWPTWYWFEVHTLFINDAKVGQPITMLVDREVKRGFNGEFQITVHRWQGGLVSYCSPGWSNSRDYVPGAVYPMPLTLDWWTDGKCYPLPAGQFQVTTRWRLIMPWPVPDKELVVRSNVFKVEP